MEMRKIGSLDVSVVGLGTNNFGFFMQAGAVPPVVDAAIEEGINFFDTADSYLDSEVRLGQALGRRRHHLALGTAIDDHQAIESQGQGPLGDLAMQPQALLTELEHGAEHRELSARPGLAPIDCLARCPRGGGPRGRAGQQG
jgi:hypothetical protein